MAGVIKTSVAKIKNNPIVSIAGGVGAFYLAKKYNLTNKYYLVGAVVLGIITGAYVSSYVKTKSSQPTKKDVK